MSVKSLCRALVIVLPLLAAAPAAAAVTCATTPPQPPMFPPAPAAFTHTAMVDGNWNSGTTWGSAGVPGDGAIVSIPAPRHVTVTSQEISRLRFIQVNGELSMWIQSSTRLFVDTLLVAPGGLFAIGDPTHTVKAGNVAELVFISWNGQPIDRNWDAEEQSRGFISMGKMGQTAGAQARIYGLSKTHMLPMTADALKGATSVTVDAAPANWSVGDQIVLTGSYFQRVTAPTSSQDERLTITGVSGSAISFSPALVYDHVRPRSDLHLHVANLTRNVVFRSESTSIPLRGHVMLMSGDVDIRDAAFVGLGRTNKAVPLDDFVVTLITDPPSAVPTDYSIAPRDKNLVTNRRGRYALHFHLNGTVPGSAPPSKVWESVVDGTVGWGFVSHSSHVDFQKNVAYNFTGAGFVTEFGDELGNFTNNVAIRGIGNGEYRPFRIVFANPARPQPLADFAFSGDGFWFQGSAVRATNNVASGCDGAGMIWHTTGSPDPRNRFDSGGGRLHDCYTGFLKTAVQPVYASFTDLASFAARHWDHSVTDELLVISDLPILECDGFEAYGNLVGFRLRFNNAGNGAWYTEDPFNFDVHMMPAYATRMREKVKNLKLWNNEQGFNIRYSSQSDWQTVSNVNRLDYPATALDEGGKTGLHYAGAEFNQSIQSTTFTDLTLDGYEVAGWIEDPGNPNFNARSDIAFSGTKSYLNYANYDTWNPALPCPTPTVLTVANTGVTSRRVDLMFNGNQKRYLVRFRVNGDQQWRYATSTTTSVNLTGLATGKTYTYRVIAGCNDTVTNKETTPSNYTTDATFST